jgi:hypothetical protein
VSALSWEIVALSLSALAPLLGIVYLLTTDKKRKRTIKKIKAAVALVWLWVQNKKQTATKEENGK